MLKKIFTVITALAVVASLLAGTAGQAAAATGYNSAYFGESAFLTLAPGASGQFAVGFNNTGSTGWLVGSASQVDLTVCLADKTTCNVTSPNAAFATGWLSSTAYATTSTTYVGPGQTGFFTYNVMAPAAATAGTYRFNGDVALHGTASMIAQQGYYQDVQVAAPGTAPTLTALTPSSGTNAGGNAVIADGTGFICNPTLPTVMFGTAAATVTSCGASTLTATAPAGANGTVQVTVANAGGAASNSLPYSYSDTTAPTFASVTAKSTAATLTFSEAVCQTLPIVAFAATDVTVTRNGINDPTVAWTLPACDVSPGATTGVTSFIVTVTSAFLAGDDVFVTLTSAGALKVQDAAGNLSTAQTREAIATADTTAPSISTAAPTSTTTIKLTYSERVRCVTGGNAAATIAQFNIKSSTGAPIAQNATGTTCSNASTGTSSITLTFLNAVTASGTVTYTAGTDPVLDLAGNAATTPQTVSFAAFAADTVAPLSQDIRLGTNTNFNLDSGDTFTAAFNEALTLPAGATIRLTDSDGTIADVICGGLSGNAGCSLNAAAMTINGVSYPANQVISVLMSAIPTVAGGATGTVTGLQFPATVTGSLLITDTSANNWDIGGSPDKILN